MELKNKGQFSVVYDSSNSKYYIVYNEKGHATILRKFEYSSYDIANYFVRSNVENLDRYVTYWREQIINATEFIDNVSDEFKIENVVSDDEDNVIENSEEVQDGVKEDDSEEENIENSEEKQDEEKEDETSEEEKKKKKEDKKRKKEEKKKRQEEKRRKKKEEKKKKKDEKKKKKDEKKKQNLPQWFPCRA